MKFTRNDFLAAPDQKIHVDETISIPAGEEAFHQTLVKSVPSCHVSGTLSFDGRSRVYSDLNLEGVLVVADSITDEDVDVDFQADSRTVYSFEPVGAEEDEVVMARKDTVDINPEIFQTIVYEAPMSITRLNREDYPKGNGWALMSDQDKKDPDDEIDPRWARLKDFEFQEDDEE